MSSREKARKKYERLRAEMAAEMREKYDRVLPLDEMLSDRWKKGALLGFGEKTNLYENVYVYGKPKIGKDVFVGPFVILDGSGGLEIGEGTDISAGVSINTHSTHMRAVSRREMDTERKRVKIGSFCYVGSNAVILPGVTIGNHCIVGAGAVVTSDIPSFSVAFGVPARVVGKVVNREGSWSIEYETKAKRNLRGNIYGRDIHP